MNIVYTKIYDFALVFEDIRGYNHNIIERRITDLIRSFMNRVDFSVSSTSNSNRLTVTVVLSEPVNKFQYEAFCVLATGIAYQYDLNLEEDER